MKTTTSFHKDGRTVTTDKTGAKRGHTFLVCISEGIATRVEVKKAVARKHLAGLYAQGWR